MNNKLNYLKRIILKWVVIILPVGIMLNFTGCYYDDVETLYPQVAGCDTTNVTYSATISADHEHKLQQLSQRICTTGWY